MIHIYTDGSCLKNPLGPGGWAFCILESDGFIICDSGSEDNTTNNRMELRAFIEAMKNIDSVNEYTIYSDSQVTINCAKNIWKRKANLDLWKEYDNFSKNKKVNFEWVKAHNGNKYNEFVDKIAYSEAKNIFK